MRKKTDEPKKSILDAAAGYADRRARSVGEVRKHLLDAGYPTDEVEYVIERMHENLMLDDERFAREYISSRLATRTFSRRQLCEQLLRRMIPREIAEAAVSEIDDESEASNVRIEATKIVAMYKSSGVDEITCIHKTVRRLVSHGYDYEEAKNAAQDAYNESDEV